MGREEQAEPWQKSGGGRGYREWEPVKAERRKFSTVKENVPTALNGTCTHPCKRPLMVTSLWDAIGAAKSHKGGTS